MSKVAFYTLGCKVNQYETEAISGIFEKAGYDIVDFSEPADVYVINTCTVTNLSDRKSRQIIRRAKSINENSIVIATGCYAQTSPQEVAGIPGVNLVVGTKDRARIVEYVSQLETGKEQINAVDNIMKARIYEELKVNAYKGHTRAFLKIQEGCSQFCAYCIIPYARGPIRSRLPEDVIEEVGRLAQNGFKEVVLTGIHVASYGKDLGTTSLLDMIQRVNEVEGIERIRLGSVEPSTITEEFVNAAKRLEKLCPHFHLSLQSGCDQTLKRMNRKYTTGEYMQVVERIRNNIQDAALTTDVIVGFPGETEEEFEQTHDFLKRVEFSKMHIFKFSPRKGTPAATFEKQVSPEVKEVRSQRLIELSDKFTKSFNLNHLGRTMPVLYEQEVKGMKGYMEGLTKNYIQVVSKGSVELKGKIVDTFLEKTQENIVIGKTINRETL
ncbi:MAG: tRNA (N(6)-L-threonylcarbamoyladenosine(37)-C(2))-methylthiotransferase MtaB [Bacillota bacterium]|nr:tRNA (N(6)-L-threonylcarbamoyladenosine(37)-C(2))-methylthiotransferase MtaB [Bacillota bacterium]